MNAEIFKVDVDLSYFAIPYHIRNYCILSTKELCFIYFVREVVYSCKVLRLTRVAL